MIHRSAVIEIKKEKKLFVYLMLWSLLVTLCMVLQAYGISYLLDQFFLKGLSIQEIGSYGNWLVIVIAIILARVFFSYIQERTSETLALETKRSLRSAVLSHLFRLGNVQTNMQGEVVHLLTDGLDQVESYIAKYIPQMMYAIAIPFSIAVAMMLLVPWVGIILFITYPLIPFFMILIGKKAAKMNEDQWSRMSFLSGHFLDILQGLTTLKFFHRAEEQERVVGRLSGEFRDSTLKVLRVAFLSAFVLELISTISTAIIAVYMGVSLLYDEVAFMSAFFILLLAPEFYVPLRELGSAFHTGMAGEVSLKKLDDFLAIPVQEPIHGTVFVDHVLIESIRLEDVTFTYNGREEPSVNNVHATLTKTKRTMLVGESGAGKSTLALLLLRLLKPQKGHIWIDLRTKEGLQTVELEELNGDSWRSRIAFIAQQPYLFKATIMENITFGLSNVTEKDVIEATKKAEAYDFIMAHPDGLNRCIGEGGQGLSGGEAQRIALTRAFLKHADILIFDEVSAHLDVEVELLISKALGRLMKEKIVLLIGHRMQTLSWANECLVMRQGEIIERGNIEGLMKEQGYFSELARSGVSHEV